MMFVHIPLTIAKAVHGNNSSRLFIQGCSVRQMTPMDIAEIRRKKLRQWIDTDPVSMGNVEAWCGHYSRFSDKPLNPTYIRQLVPERGFANRNIGERTARKLECAGRKPHGYLDSLLNDGQDQRMLRDENHATDPGLSLSSNTQYASIQPESKENNKEVQVRSNSAVVLAFPTDAPVVDGYVRLDLLSTRPSAGKGSTVSELPHVVNKCERNPPPLGVG